MLFKSTLFSAFVLSFFLTFVSAVPTKIVERTTSAAKTSQQASLSGETYLACVYHSNNPFFALIPYLCQYWISGSSVGTCNKSGSYSYCPDSAIKACNSSKRTVDEDTETAMQRRIRKRQWSAAKLRRPL
ncbi:hypothetical protein [Phaffia rhodozyma]|uniref:Secreted protein n=1 Tax=Phaffia rhodozyma TaxID=264483 RepID=A0A0F7SU05_PHARH|nr:hypothetical protein [Phaffia rhodozyma]